MEVAEYAVAQGLDEEPAFLWWVPHMLKKRERIIKAVNKCYHKRTHKFGFEIPKDAKQAKEIYDENDNTLWQDAIAKETKNVRIAFKVLGDNNNLPVNYEFVGCHMIYKINSIASFVRQGWLLLEIDWKRHPY